MIQEQKKMKQITNKLKQEKEKQSTGKKKEERKEEIQYDQKIQITISVTKRLISE